MTLDQIRLDAADLSAYNPYLSSRSRYYHQFHLDQVNAIWVGETDGGYIKLVPKICRSITGTFLLHLRLYVSARHLGIGCRHDNGLSMEFANPFINRLPTY